MLSLPASSDRRLMIEEALGRLGLTGPLSVDISRYGAGADPYALDAFKYRPSSHGGLSILTPASATPSRFGGNPAVLQTTGDDNTQSFDGFNQNEHRSSPIRQHAPSQYLCARDRAIEVAIHMGIPEGAEDAFANVQCAGYNVVRTSRLSALQFRAARDSLSQLTAASPSTIIELLAANEEGAVLPENSATAQAQRLLQARNFYDDCAGDAAHADFAFFPQVSTPRATRLRWRQRSWASSTSGRACCGWRSSLD